jgi:hypothetical protein
MSQLPPYLKFIEVIAYWEGGVNAGHLKRYFGLSRQQAVKYIDQYQALASQNLHYCRINKTYLASEVFELKLSCPDLQEYFRCIHGTVSIIEQSQITLTHLELPQRAITPHIMRPLIAAMRKGHQVDIQYLSLKDPQGKRRTIVPFQFVTTGLRWHVRAYCEESQGFRDFVLSRMTGLATLGAASTRTIQQDIQWSTLVNVILVPDPRLNAEQKQVIQRDYQMIEGRLSIPTRACMVGYLLQSLHINTKTLDANPEAQQLICENLKELKPYLFS